MASSPMPTGPPISQWPVSSSAYPTQPRQAAIAMHRRWSRRRRLEHLSLLRRAHDHHRDLRTRLPAPALAHAISPPRQLMISTRPSPSPITAPLRRRHLTGNGRAPPTATVSAGFHHQNADHPARHHRFGCTHGAQNHGRGTRSAVSPDRKSKITSNTGAKSP